MGMRSYKTLLASLLLAAFAVLVLPSCTATDIGVAQFRSPQRAVARCIVKRESGGNARAISATKDYGLFQINRKAHKAQFERMYGAPFERKALDPVLNGKYAAYLYSVAGWSPWRGGKYRCF